MSKKRIGVSTATSEAARRQLMQPVDCWERRWVKPDVNASFQVLKWVKTSAKQQFSDDEGDVDDPLAPLPDEPEVVEADEEMDQDDAATSAPAITVPPSAIDTANHTPAPPSAIPSKAPSPAPPPENAPDGEPALAPEFAPQPQLEPEVVLDPATELEPEPEPEPEPVLELGLEERDPPADALGYDLDVMEGISEGDMAAAAAAAAVGAGFDDLQAMDVTELDLSALPPDGVPFEAAHDLTQMDETDAILGGPIMDHTGDPFTAVATPPESAPTVQLDVPETTEVVPELAAEVPIEPVPDPVGE